MTNAAGRRGAGLPGTRARSPPVGLERLFSPGFAQELEQISRLRRPRHDGAEMHRPPPSCRLLLHSHGGELTKRYAVGFRSRPAALFTEAGNFKE